MNGLSGAQDGPGQRSLPSLFWMAEALRNHLKTDPEPLINHGQQTAQFDLIWTWNKSSYYTAL